MFISKLNPVYKFLSQQTHAQGLDIINLQEGRDNVPRFLHKSYDIWYGKTLEAFDAICFLYKTFFPNEIASYMKDRPKELERLNNQQKKFKKMLIEFSDLVDEINKLV